MTYTPRLLLVDLKGSLGYLSQEGNLEEIDENPISKPTEILWEENLLEKKIEPVADIPPFIKSLDKIEDEKNEIEFDLEKDSNNWVDFLVPRFHPRTVNVVKEYEHESSINPFDLFPYGQQLWKSESFVDGFTDRIRSYVEECDMMQGFQVWNFFSQIHYTNKKKVYNFLIFRYYWMQKMGLLV